MSEESLPALSAVSDSDLRSAGLPSVMEMSPALAIFFNDALYNRCKQIAGIMAKAEGVMPKHLLGKPEACFMVISRAVVWKMDPTAVAMCTYQTPGGSIGFEGRLVHAVIENSGQIDGPVKYTLTGDWGKVRGKFKWGTSAKGNKYAMEGWDPNDEEGLGVTVTAKVKGELEARSEDFLLSTFHPRNSTLWALRPEQQIKYAACRAFANTAVPGILLGASFDVDTTNLGGEGPLDITPPKPVLTNEFDRSPARDPVMGDWQAKLNHATKLTEIGDIRAAGLKDLPERLHSYFEEQADTRAKQIIGDMTIKEVSEEEGHPQAAEGEQRDKDEAEPEPQAEDGNKAAPATEATGEPEKKAEPEKPAAADSKKAPAAGKAAAKKADAPGGTEGPLARGKRLLAKVDTAGDVQELLKSISDELKGADLVEWKQACAERQKEVSK